MDGADASLIEISEEDDSLLSSPLLPTAAASPPSSFACSPLVRFPKPPLYRSSSRRIRTPLLPPGGGEEEGCEPGSSVFSASKNGSEKENDEANKLEAGKLSLEPQQMKRKKKGAGFNLRKSLAWNRAFFTEEGVLDPSELSILSGNIGDSTGLSTIQEGRESVCSVSDATNTSPSLRKLENKLFKEFPVNRVIEGRKLAGIMSPKPGSATREKLGSAAAAKRKIIPSPDANKSASKRGGYPLSTAISSLRKPSTESMTKVVNKGSKLSRLFTSKPDRTIASVSRSHTVAASQLKQNQTAKPVTIQKSVAAKITAAKVKAAQENVKCGPSSNSMRKPIEQFKRNVVRSGSSANVRHHATNQTANKEAEVRDVILHPAASSPDVVDVGVLKTMNSFSQNAANSLHTQPQAAKPSGLRMPSPSLGYFGQSKTSGPQSLPQRTQLCNLQQSGIPTSASAGVLKPTQLRPSLPRQELNHSSTGNLVASITNPVLHGKAKHNAQSDVIRNLDGEALCSSKSLRGDPMVHDVTTDTKLQSFELGQPNSDVNVSETEDQMLLSNLQNGVTQLSKHDLDDDERVAITDSQQKSTELIIDYPMMAPHLSLQAKTGILSEKQAMTSSQEVDPVFNNVASSSHVISSEIQFENVNCNIDKGASKVPKNHSCSVHDGNKQLQEQPETKPFVDADSQGIKTEKSLKTAGGSRLHDLGILPNCLSFCKEAEEVKDVADKADHLGKASQVRDANIQAIGFVAPVESSKNDLHSLNDDTSDSLLGDSLLVGKQTSVCDHISSNNACLLPEQSLSSKPSIDNDLIQSVRSVPETFTHADGSTDCTINSPEAFLKQDSGCDIAVEVHQMHEGNAPTSHVVKEVTVKTSSHKIELQGGSGPMLLECKDQVLHTVPSCQMELSDVCLNFEHIMESDLEDTNNFKFSNTHVEVISKFNERNDHELLLDKQINHYDEQSTEAAQSQGSYDNLVFEDEKSTEDAVGSLKEKFTVFVETCESRSGNASSVSQSIIKKHENKYVEAENMVTEKDNYFQSDVRPEDDFGMSVSAVKSGSLMVVHDTSGSSQECSETQIFKLVTGELSITNQEAQNMVKEKVNNFHSDITPEDDFGISVSAVKSESPMVVQDTGGSSQECSETQIFNFATGELFIENQDLLSDDDLSSMDISSTESEDSFADTDSVVQATILNNSSQSNDLMTEHMSLENHDMHLGERLACTNTSPWEAPVSEGFAETILDIEVPPALHSSDPDMDKNSFDQHMHAEALSFSELESSGENDSCSNVCKSGNHNECREHDTSLELDSSLTKRGPLIQVAEDNGTSDQSNDLMTEHMPLENRDMNLDEKLACSDTSPRKALVSDGFADVVLDIEVPPAVLSSDLDMDKNSSDALCFPEFESSVEKDLCSDVHSKSKEHDTSLELDSSLTKPGALISVAEDNGTCNLPSSSSRELESVKCNAMSNGDCQQGEAQLPESSMSSRETTDMIQNSSSQLLQELESAMSTAEHKDATLETCKPEKDGKKGALTIKPPPDAVPFSEEWLAAFEAAGEEILTMKSGAVQNSPPDKSAPEPSPWSPVKRKNNQEIGPFDCTKMVKPIPARQSEVNKN